MHYLLALATAVPVIVLVAVAAAANVAGDYVAKLWSEAPQVWLYAGAVALYGLSGFIYIPSLLREGLIVTSMAWTLITFIGFVLVGLFIFGEHLTTLQWAGVGCGVVALVLLSV